jgi:thiosulfate/3-mercaptopyruvate sulfurtransferase
MSLISAAELLTRIRDPELRIADVRWSLAEPGKGRRDYEAGHIPGAVFVDLDTDLSATSGPGRHPLPEPAAFADRLGALGFGIRHDIVVYDDAGGTIAARLWWMLDNLGHPRVRVLDGGIGAWTDAGGQITAEPPSHAPAALDLADRWSRVIERDDLANRLGELVLVDVRAPERYRGDVEPVDPVAGHIPGALNIPAASMFAPDGRFLPAAELRARFEARLGSSDEASDRTQGGEPGPVDARGGRQVVTSCGSGVTACHGALAMRVAGLPDPLLYPGSYSDWSRSGMPVATGDEPGGHALALGPAHDPETA